MKQVKERDIIILTDDRWWNKKGMSYNNTVNDLINFEARKNDRDKQSRRFLLKK